MNIKINNRRNKKEMTLMRIECSYYLEQCNNDPFVAFDIMITDFVTNRKNLPYYIEGIDDFKKVAREIKNQNKRKEKLKKD